MVWINEICWNEMNVNEELTLRCSDPFCRSAEESLRQTIYRWEHLPADMIVEPVFYVSLIIWPSWWLSESRALWQSASMSSAGARRAAVTRRAHARGLLRVVVPAA